jgi:hypothetical protein
MIPPLPVPPQYEPQQIADVKMHDVLQRQQPATAATWAIGIVLVVAASAWVTLAITRSHHTSVMPPDAVSAPAAPRSATRAP